MANFNIDVLADVLQAATRFEALRAAFIQFFEENGVKRMSYHHLPPPGAPDYKQDLTVIAHGFPDAWVKRYVEERLFDIDPIPRASIASTEPSWWSDARHLPDLTEDERRYLDILDAEGLGVGIAVPVFGPFRRNGYCGVGFGVPEKPPLDLPTMKRVQWACQLGHQRYCELLKETAPEQVSLSSREREILEWVARGKSNSVIADIVGISANTVDTYIRRIFAKLGVADRVTAALRGMALGVLN